MDELHTAWTIADGLGELPARARQGNQSACYFYIPWAFSQGFGLTEPALRFPSVLAGLAVVLLLFAMVRCWTKNNVAALAAAALAAVDPDFVFFSTEARSYALVQLVALVQIALLLEVVRRPLLKLRMLLIAATLLLFYLHYTTALLFVGEAVWLLASSVIPGKREESAGKAACYCRWKILCDVFVVLLGMTPALPHLLEISARRGNWKLFVDTTPAPGLVRGLPLLVLLPVLIYGAAMLLRRLLHKASPAKKISWRLPLLLLSAGVIPPTLAWFSTAANIAPLNLLRYFVASTVLWIAFAAVLIAMLSGRRLQIAAAVLVLLAALFFGGLPQQYLYDGRFIADRQENWRGVAAAIRKDDSAIPIFLYSGLIEADAPRPFAEPLALFCSSPLRSIYPVGEELTIVPLRALEPWTLTEQDVRLLREAGQGWLVVRGGCNLQSRLFRWLQSSARSQGLKLELKEVIGEGGVVLHRINSS